MRSQPHINICIPSYNSEEFIVVTLESVLLQSVTDFDVIDPRINPIENEQDLSLGANWNKALSRVRGEYVKLLGDHDILHSEPFSRQVAGRKVPMPAPR